MYCKETEKKAEDILEVLKNQLKKDESIYNSEISRLERAAREMYDISELNRLLQIVMDVRKASEKLHASCETIVRMVDVQYGAIDSDKLSHKNLTEVVKFIQYVNEKVNNIENNFELRVDYGVSNDVGSINYSPSVEALTIQKSWEMKLALHKETDEEKEVRKKEKKNKAQKEKRQQKKIQERKMELQKEKIRAYEKWKETVEKIEEKRNESKAIEAERLERIYEKNVLDFKTKEKGEITRVEREIDTLLHNKMELSEEMRHLGALQFLKKNILKSKLERTQESIINKEQEKESIANKYDEMIKNLKEKNANDYTMICKRIDEQNPLPEDPTISPEEKEKKRLKKLILETIGESDGLTISELQKKNYELGDYSNQKITSLTKELVNEGKVYNFVVERKTKFRVI